ncbi:hypothetical protein COH20_007242 [Aspergillus flavus]|nr:hypothetical protein COH20_007242 [Aspergillus flavus]
MVLADGMVCSAVWAVLQSLSEITIVFPVSGNYIDYADLWVDPALAFGAGFADMERNCRIRSGLLQCAGAVLGRGIFASRSYRLSPSSLQSAYLSSYSQQAGGVTVLNWLIAISSASFFTNWGIIAFTNWHFHCAPKAQKDILFSETYGWKSTFWSSTPAWLMLVSLMLLVCCLECGVKPVDGLTFTAENFLQYTLGLWVITGCTLVYKVIFRTPWRDPKTADCITGRRTLGGRGNHGS